MLNTTLLAVVPLVALPLTVTLAGERAWSAVAVGQAIGNFGATIAAFGWPVIGPALVAGSNLDKRVDFYRRSVFVRLTLVLCGSILTCGLSVLITGLLMLPILSCLSSIVLALSGGWYFIGVAAPKRLLLYDTTPRLVCLLSGVALSLLFANIWVFLVAQIFSGICAALLASMSVGREAPGRPWMCPAWNDVVSDLKTQKTSVAASLTSAAYVSLPLPIVAFINPSLSGPLAACQRLQKFWVSMMKALVQYMQGWVPSASPRSVNRRARVAALVALMFAVITTVLFAVFGPGFLDQLSQGAFRISSSLAAILGALTGAIVASQTCGLACLTALGKADSLLRSSMVGSLVGLIGIPFGTYFLGFYGAVSSLALAELAVLGFQVYAIFTAKRQAQLPVGGS